jgi:hypothetical protein
LCRYFGRGSVLPPLSKDKAENEAYFRKSKTSQIDCDAAGHPGFGRA